MNNNNTYVAPSIVLLGNMEDLTGSGGSSTIDYQVMSWPP